MKRYRSVKLDSDIQDEDMYTEDIEGEGNYSQEFDTFDYSGDTYQQQGYSEEGYSENESYEEGYHEPEDGIAEVVYDEDKFGKDEDDLQREDAIPGVDDAHISMGENTHNEGDYTEAEFNLKGIIEDDYSDGL